MAPVNEERKHILSYVVYCYTIFEMKLSIIKRLPGPRQYYSTLNSVCACLGFVNHPLLASV